MSELDRCFDALLFIAFESKLVSLIDAPGVSINSISRLLYLIECEVDILVACSLFETNAE
jgi:hypothetical protein